ncbi:MAG: aconitase X catalytic domain-containing protein [Rhodospirillales bacterium]
MHLTDEQRRWADGDAGPSLQWAMAFNVALGRFFGAERMVPVTSAHFAPDTRMGGDAETDLLRKLVGEGARVCVPSYLDPCAVDFGRAAELVADYGLTDEFVAADRETQKLCRDLGFVPTYTCVNYQTVTPPAFGEHVAWGDTGTAISANSIFGARTNFEGGPSALASALLGFTPAYGMHLDASRRGNLVIEIACDPREIADWGAVAAWSGRIATGYDTVPVFCGDFERPTFAMLKQLGVALASYGGHAMFHVVGVTPEAPSLEAACGGAAPAERHTMTKADLETVFAAGSFASGTVDLVVFAAPQLAIDEVFDIVGRLGERRINAHTKLIMAVDPQVKLQADNAGITEKLTRAGGEFSTGTCFYMEAPLMREATGWKTVVSNSAKLVNTLAPSGYSCALRRIDDCIEAAVTGRLPS